MKMSKERYNEIIDMVYRDYEVDTSLGNCAALNPQAIVEGWAPDLIDELSKEEFINQCKTDHEFSERWGLKIEEQKLTEERRYNIWFNNNYETGMERFFNPEQLPDYDNPYYTPTPTKEITISYNGEKIEMYE
jgi:hypothetical protein